MNKQEEKRLYDKKRYSEKKDIINKQNRENYWKRREYYLTKAKDNYFEKRDEKLLQSKLWAEKNKTKTNEYKKKWKKNNSFKCKIQQQTSKKYGTITEDCLLCDNKAECRHHHTNPYEVDKFWNLCTQCHNKIHRKIKWE